MPHGLIGGLRVLIDTKGSEQSLAEVSALEMPALISTATVHLTSSRLSLRLREASGGYGAYCPQVTLPAARDSASPAPPPKPPHSRGLSPMGGTGGSGWGHGGLLAVGGEGWEPREVVTKMGTQNALTQRTPPGGGFFHSGSGE